MKTTRSLARKIIPTIVFAMALLAATCCLTACSGNEKAKFDNWNPNAPALTVLKDYVADVTSEKSPNYIPPEDRIAVFDMDGTLYGEKAPIYIEWAMYAHRVLHDSNYTPTAEQISIAEQIEEAGKTGVIPENLEMDHARAQAEVFAGMSYVEYTDYVTKFCETKAPGFGGLTYAQMWYLPMLEIVDFLNENGFITYICSGTDRAMCRAMASGHVAIPEERIIGMDVAYTITGQSPSNGHSSVFVNDSRIERTSQLLIKNVKANKVYQIIQEIGKMPVLSFGNSSGDTSMHAFATAKNPYRSSAFMVVADDDVRENGNVEAAKKSRAQWEENGWNVISMHDDFKHIYEKDRAA